jgi:hypothetical protein
MKILKSLRVPLLLVGIMALANHSNGQSSASKYLDDIGSQFESITADMWDYSAAVAHGKSARKVEKRRKEVLNSITDAKKKVESMPGFEGDKTFRDAVVAYLKLDYNVMNNDYAKIVDMEEVAEQSYDAMEAYLLAQEMASQKLHAANDELNARQSSFAGAHGITITESTDKTSKKLEAAGLVFKYYNKAYLIFFKSYKQEAYMIDAMNKNNLNALKQNADALAKTSAEGMKKMDSLAPFNGDASIKTEGNELMKFYKNEALKDCPVMIAYSVKKENFDKMKKSFDAKKTHNQEEADEFNKSVAELNKANADYQKVNQELNNKRSDLLNKWNDTVARFLDKQVPKKK